MAALAGVAMGAGFGTPASLFVYGRSSCAMDTANAVKCWGRGANAGANAGGVFLSGPTGNTFLGDVPAETGDGLPFVNH